MSLTAAPVNSVTDRQYEWDARHQQLPPCWIQRNSTAAQQLHKKTSDDGRIYVTDSSGLLRNKLLSALRKAEEMVCVTSFLLADAEIVKALLEVSKRGCR